MEFQEKPAGQNSWINGGFFVLNPKVIDRIDEDESWEGNPLATLAQDRQLSSFRHQGFWHPMDTLRDKNLLNRLWDAGKAPWQTW
jgi:glucose-1-phosphate cytidylyltransferase